MSPQSSTVLHWARGLRFPTLFMLTAGVLVLDLVLLDPIPFVDEVLIGLATLMLASWKRRRAERDPEVPASDPARVVADYPQRKGSGDMGSSAPPPLPDSHGNP